MTYAGPGPAPPTTNRSVMKVREDSMILTAASAVSASSRTFRATSVVGVPKRRKSVLPAALTRNHCAELRVPIRPLVAT